jgi:hypothetical protein
MLKRRLHYIKTDPDPPPNPPPLPPNPEAARIINAAIEPPEETVETAESVVPAVPGAAETIPAAPVATGVGGPADSRYADMASETLLAIEKKAGPPVVSNTIRETGEPASVVVAGSGDGTYETLTRAPTATRAPLDAAVSASTSRITGPRYDTTTTGARTVTYPTLTGPADAALVWTGSPEEGRWQYKGNQKGPLSDDILGSAISYSFDDFSSWPQSRKEIFYQEMKERGDTLAQFDWAYKQKMALSPYSYDRSALPPYMDPSVALRENLSGPGANKAIESFDRHAKSHNLSSEKRWNAAYNAKNLEPKQVYQALKSNGKSGAGDNATIAEVLAGGSTEDDLDLEMDPARATGPLVENHEGVSAKAEQILDAAAAPVLRNIDGLKVDVSGDFGSIQSELDAVKTDLELTPQNLQGKEPYKTRMAAAIAAGTGDAEYSEIQGELEQKRDALQTRLEQASTAHRQHEIVGEIKTQNETLTERKEDLAKIKKEEFFLLRDAEANEKVDAAAKLVSDTEKEIKKLEEEDKTKEPTGLYHERYDAAVEGLAKFLTLQNGLTAAARSADTETMTRLFKENGINEPVIPTTAGLQKRTAAIEAETAVTTAQNLQAKAKRDTRNEKWDQTKKDVGTLNEGLKFGTDLLATGSGAISSVSEAKKAIDALLGNDGKMGESFTAVQGDILSNATKLKTFEEVLAGQKALLDAAGVGGEEDSYGESGSPAERLRKMLDRDRATRFGDALGLNEQGEDVVSFGTSVEEANQRVAQNSVEARLRWEEKNGRFYQQTDEGGMKA